MYLIGISAKIIPFFLSHMQSDDSSVVPLVEPQEGWHSYGQDVPGHDANYGIHQEIVVLAQVFFKCV